MLISCLGVRGATTADANTSAAIGAATRELLHAVVMANGIEVEQIGSVLFSTTPDLTADFPAAAARTMGWVNTALLCTHEMAAPASLERCIRVVIHWNTARSARDLTHVYLRGAQRLRPDWVRRMGLQPAPATEVRVWGASAGAAASADAIR